MRPGTHFYPYLSSSPGGVFIKASLNLLCLHMLVFDMKVAVTSSEDESLMIKAGSNVEMSTVRWQSW